MAVVSLGGTIASVPAPGTDSRGVLPRLTADDLVAGLPGVGDVAEIETHSFRQLPSSDLTVADVVELAGFVRERLSDGVDGVVVTQGTDTIEEVAYALALLVPPGRPLVVTGAMRTAAEVGADGPANLTAAVLVAAAPGAADVGTVVVINDEIHDARFVQKTHTSNAAAFRSMPIGPIGWITEKTVRIATRPSRPVGLSVAPGQPLPAVALLTVTLGDDARLVDAVADLGYQGVVVEGLGGGHVPARMVPALARLAASVPVLLASRTGSGDVLTGTYAFEGSETSLLASELRSAGMLPGPKARVLLTLLLASGARGSDLHELIDRAGSV